MAPVAVSNWLCSATRTSLNRLDVLEVQSKEMKEALFWATSSLELVTAQLQKLVSIAGSTSVTSASSLPSAVPVSSPPVLPAAHPRRVLQEQVVPEPVLSRPPPSSLDMTACFVKLLDVMLECLPSQTTPSLEDDVCPGHFHDFLASFCVVNCVDGEVSFNPASVPLRPGLHEVRAQCRHVKFCIRSYDSLDGDFESDLYEQCEWKDESDLKILSLCAKKLGLQSVVDIIEIVLDGRCVDDLYDAASDDDAQCPCPPRDRDLIHI